MSRHNLFSLGLVVVAYLSAAVFDVREGDRIEPGFDLVAVEADELLGPHRVLPGDVVIAMAASGLHANGFSLVRQIVDRPGAGLDLDAAPAELSQALGAELLTPTRIYARDCRILRCACPRAHHRRRAGGEPVTGAAAARGRQA